MSELSPTVRMDNETITRLHLMVMKTYLFPQIADVINRLSPQGKVPYTKLEVPNGTARLP